MGFRTSHLFQIDLRRCTYMNSTFEIALAHHTNKRLSSATIRFMVFYALRRFVLLKDCIRPTNSLLGFLLPSKAFMYLKGFSDLGGLKTRAISLLLLQQSCMVMAVREPGIITIAKKKRKNMCAQVQCTFWCTLLESIQLTRTLRREPREGRSRKANGTLKNQVGSPRLYYFHIHLRCITPDSHKEWSIRMIGSGATTLLKQVPVLLKSKILTGFQAWNSFGNIWERSEQCISSESAGLNSMSLSHNRKFCIENLLSFLSHMRPEPKQF